MRKHVIALASIVLLVLVFLLSSCVPQNANANSSAPTDNILRKSDLEAYNKTVDSALSKKLDQSVWDAWKKDYTAPDTYTKKEIEELIGEAVENAIADLKDELEVEEEESNNQSLEVDGEQVATNKEIELWLTRISPASDSLIFSGQQSVRMDFDVLNTNATSSHNFTVTLYLYPDDPEENYWADGIDAFSDVELDVDERVPSGTAKYGDSGAASEPIIILCTNGWVGKNDVTSFTLTAVVHVDGSAEFDYDYSIRQTN